MASVAKIAVMIGIVVVAIAVLVVVFWFVLVPKATVAPVSQPAASATPQGLGADIYQKTQAQQQVTVPSVNPVASSNPIQNAYKNPF